MNIQQEILEKFIKAVKMDSTAKVTECILTFGDDGLSLKALTSATAVFMSGVLNKSNFEAYENIGDIAVRDLGELYDVVKRFDKKEKLKLANQDPFLVIEANKVFKIKTVNKETITSLPALPNIDGTNVLKLTTDQLDDFIQDLNAVKAESFIVSVQPKKVIFYAKELHECISTFNGDMLNDEMKIKFGKPLISALSGIKGELTITFVKSDYPIKIHYKTEQMNIVFIVAPMASEE